MKSGKKVRWCLLFGPFLYLCITREKHRLIYVQIFAGEEGRNSTSKA